MITTKGEGVSRCSFSSTSIPPIPGMCRSRSTPVGLRFSAAASPSGPEVAERTRYSLSRWRVSVRFSCSSSSIIRRGGLGPGFLSSYCREDEMECGSLSMLTVNIDVSSMLLHYPLAQREAQSPPPFLGRVKRFPDPLEVFWGDAASGICNLDLYFPLPHRLVDDNPQGATCRHCFQGVLTKV